MDSEEEVEKLKVDLGEWNSKDKELRRLRTIMRFSQLKKDSDQLQFIKSRMSEYSLPLESESSPLIPGRAPTASAVDQSVHRESNRAVSPPPLLAVPPGKHPQSLAATLPLSQSTCPVPSSSGVSVVSPLYPKSLVPPPPPPPFSPTVPRRERGSIHPDRTSTTTRRRSAPNPTMEDVSDGEDYMPSRNDMRDSNLSSSYPHPHSSHHIHSTAPRLGSLARPQTASGNQRGGNPKFQSNSIISSLFRSDSPHQDLGKPLRLGLPNESLSQSHILSRRVQSAPWRAANNPCSASTTPLVPPSSVCPPHRERTHSLPPSSSATATTLLPAQPSLSNHKAGGFIFVAGQMIPVSSTHTH